MRAKLTTTAIRSLLWGLFLYFVWRETQGPLLCTFLGLLVLGHECNRYGAHRAIEALLSMREYFEKISAFTVPPEEDDNEKG